MGRAAGEPFRRKEQAGKSGVGARLATDGGTGAHPDEGAGWSGLYQDWGSSMARGGR